MAPRFEVSYERSEKWGMTEMNINMCNELKFSDVYQSKLHWVTSEVYMNPFGVCM